MPDFEWTNERIEAAQLVAYGELEVGDIAAKLGVSARTLYEWRRVPEFAARVDEIIEDIKASLRRRKVSHVEQRVARLNRDWLRLQKVFEERAADPAMKGVPGGETGLLVHTVKGVGKGDDFQLIDQYEVDAGALRELREIEKQAAQELGQWVEKKELAESTLSKQLGDLLVRTRGT
jgi:transposase-like protein